MKTNVHFCAHRKHDNLTLIYQIFSVIKTVSDENFSRNSYRLQDK